ncbi:rhamnulose-1-phosphate aldolase [Escherichia coli]
MQNITQSWFVQGMIKATTDAWLKGWDERNGGNLTLRLDDADIAPIKTTSMHNRAISRSASPCLYWQIPVYVTGSGKFFRNVQLDPAANLGVVKVDSDGASYHLLWGLTNEAVPTSQLPAHFLSHCERIKATNGKDRVIMRCHATNLIALAYVLENNTAVFTRQLWEGSTSVWWYSRMALAFCRGWCRHGRNGQATAQRCKNIRWCCGPSTASSAAGRRWMKHSV